jgi:hypothetical protein
MTSPTLVKFEKRPFETVAQQKTGRSGGLKKAITTWAFSALGTVFPERRYDRIESGGVGERLKPVVLKNEIADSLSRRKID